MQRQISQGSNADQRIYRTQSDAYSQHLPKQTGGLFSPAKRTRRYLIRKSSRRCIAPTRFTREHLHGDGCVRLRGTQQHMETLGSIVPAINSALSLPSPSLSYSTFPLIRGYIFHPSVEINPKQFRRSATVSCMQIPQRCARGMILRRCGTGLENGAVCGARGEQQVAKLFRTGRVTCNGYVAS